MRALPILAIAAFSLAGPAAADVRDVGPNGFSVGGTVDFDVPAREAFTVLVRPQLWWSDEHTYFGRAAGLILETRVGGCWCETAPVRREVEHMRVIYSDLEGRLIRLQGALGPLQELAVSGTMTFRMVDRDGGSRLEWSYNVGGYRPGGFADLAPAVDGVLEEQLTRLAATVSGGAGRANRLPPAPPR